MDPWSYKVRGFVTRVVLILSSTCWQTTAEVCRSPLLSNLLPLSFRSSSQLSSSHGPAFAKLNRREGAGGWSPLTSDLDQWLEVDLGRRTKVAAVSTQGRYGSSDWVTAYQLTFSDTGHNWRQYRQEDSLGAFLGNSNADSVVQHRLLQRPVVTRFIRLIPLEWSRSGRIGLRLEAYGCPHNSAVLGFDGGSSLLYRLSPGATESISLSFKTLRNSGTLLHARGQSQRSLSLGLEKGRILLLLQAAAAPGRAGSSPVSHHRVSLGSLLDDQQWHQVTVQRYGGRLNLTVDESSMLVPVPPTFTHWDHQQMSVGAKRLLDSTHERFHGCLENLLYNGVNLVELARQRDQRVTAQGSVTFSCAEPTSAPVTFAGPHSFLRLPVGAPASTGVSVGLQFRTWNEAGLLLTFKLTQQAGAVWLFLSRARLFLQVHMSGRTPQELSTGSALNDGQWHRVDVTSDPGRLSVTVDGGGGSSAHASPPFLIAAGSPLFFGGCPAGASSRECTNPFSSFLGCMSQLTANGQPVDLMKVQQRLLGDFGHLQIDMCGIIDRCSQSHCEHGGHCSQSWSTFHCNCSDTGYGGATCHSSIYEQSCEAYKHRGNMSGFYFIDVDGSGPVEPQRLYCDMAEDRTWTVVQHNNSELTTVPGGTGRNSVHFEYMSSEEQLAAIIDQSEHCQQELSFLCRKSRPFNIPDGPPVSWWVGGAGERQVQTEWGGAQPGGSHCTCCMDPRMHCNCDTDHTERANDSALLTHKQSLPVRSLVLADMHRPEAESAAYRLGDLRCHGDKNLWNAAFFDQETSYLHFPTLHGELSADISFLFKTTSSSGVFLENLGIKDFIRIELCSTTEVLFSFDVGNGPLEVHVVADAPLNDGRWHRVRAERNVKEAWLQLDQLPPATREAPAHGHTHLQLNSQLFIGGTASRQRGFRGCIRSLQLNGVTLDLEERARITPGVQAGCPGHCSSYGALCRNGGSCVEGSSSFSCDCSPSAFTGAFCEREVSAGFKSGTSVSYIFQEAAGNSSSSSSSSVLTSSIQPDTSLRAENISLNFRTSHSPALLLYVSSYSREYLALLLNQHDQLEVHYRLDSSQAADILRSRVQNLADGQLHAVTVSRRADSVSVQIDENRREDFNLTSDVELNGVRSLILGKVHDSELEPQLSRPASSGFIGCLSAVLFNSVSPLKAALLRPDRSPVVVSGTLLPSPCSDATSVGRGGTESTRSLSGQPESGVRGQPMVNAIRGDSALIGGVIAAVIFVAVSLLAVAARVLYRRKDSGSRQQVKAVRGEDGLELNGHSQTQREFFI